MVVELISEEVDFISKMYRAKFSVKLSSPLNTQNQKEISDFFAFYTEKSWCNYAKNLWQNSLRKMSIHYPPFVSNLFKKGFVITNFEGRPITLTENATIARYTDKITVACEFSLANQKSITKDVIVQVMQDGILNHINSNPMLFTDNVKFKKTNENGEEVLLNYLQFEIENNHLIAIPFWAVLSYTQLVFPDMYIPDHSHLALPPWELSNLIDEVVW